MKGKATRETVWGLALWLVFACAPTGSGADTAPAARPHVVFFLADDLGWADLGCYASSFHRTPNLDRLRASGTRFTQAYAAASICSPTRASLMTGKHPVRVNITDWIPGRGDRGERLRTPEDRHFLELDETTLGEALQAGGYRTFYAGKWHLGGTEHAPDKQGFDVYFDPHRDPSGGSPKPRAEGRPHDTAGITREALRFIDREARSGPVLLYLSYYDVHTPIVQDDRFIEDYQARVRTLAPRSPIVEHRGLSRAQQDNPAYGTMVAAIDDSVGQVLERFDELGLADRTVVVFFSDNGGLCTLRQPGPTCNLPLRSGKGWLYEGGIRVPLIIRAPGLANPGQDCATPVVSMDLYPTLLELAGLPLRPDQHRDGVSLLPLLKGEPELGRSTLYWHYPHYHGSTWTPGAALRDGDWKLIEFYEDGKTELYNLAVDPGERNDLAAGDPVRTQAHLEKLHAWQRNLGARLPKPRPSADPSSN